MNMSQDFLYKESVIRDFVASLSGELESQNQKLDQDKKNFYHNLQNCGKPTKPVTDNEIPSKNNINEKNKVGK